MSENMTQSDTQVGRVSKGPRDTYFSDPAIDKLHTMVLITLQELAVARDRIDTLERLLDKAGVVGPSQVDTYEPSADVQSAREERHAIMLKRVFRASQKEFQDRISPVTVTEKTFT